MVQPQFKSESWIDPFRKFVSNERARACFLHTWICQQNGALKFESIRLPHIIIFNMAKGCLSPQD